MNFSGEWLRETLERHEWIRTVTVLLMLSQIFFWSYIFGFSPQLVNFIDSTFYSHFYLKLFGQSLISVVLAYFILATLQFLASLTPIKFSRYSSVRRTLRWFRPHQDQIRWTVSGIVLLWSFLGGKALIIIFVFGVVGAVLTLLPTLFAIFSLRQALDKLKAEAARIRENTENPERMIEKLAKLEQEEKRILGTGFLPTLFLRRFPYLKKGLTLNVTLAVFTAFIGLRLSAEIKDQNDTISFPVSGISGNIIGKNSAYFLIYETAEDRLLAVDEIGRVAVIIYNDL